MEHLTPGWCPIHGQVRYCTVALDACYSMNIRLRQTIVQRRY